jgi:hypothetical protein
VAPSSVTGHPRQRKAAEQNPDLRKDRLVMTRVIGFYRHLLGMRKIYQILSGLLQPGLTAILINQLK